MHICFVLPDLAPISAAAGGAAQASQLAAVALAQAGHAVTLLTPGSDAPAQMDGITHVALTRTTQSRCEQLRALLLDPDSPALATLAFGLATRDWLRSNVARPAGAIPVDVIETPAAGGAGALLLEEWLPPVLTFVGAPHPGAGTTAVADADRRLVAGLESILLALADAVVAERGADVVGLSAAVGREMLDCDDTAPLAGRLAAYAAAQARRRARNAQGFVSEGINPLVSQLIILAENAGMAGGALAEFNDSVVTREAVKRGLRRTGLLPVVRAVLKR